MIWPKQQSNNRVYAKTDLKEWEKNKTIKIKLCVSSVKQAELWKDKQK